MDQPKKKGKRIYEVAKQYHISSEALIAMLRNMGREVKSHMSIVHEDMLAQISRKFEEERESSRREIQRKKVRAEERKHEAESTPTEEASGDRGKRRKRSPKKGYGGKTDGGQREGGV